MAGHLVHNERHGRQGSLIDNDRGGVAVFSELGWAPYISAPVPAARAVLKLYVTNLCSLMPRVDRQRSPTASSASSMGRSVILKDHSKNQPTVNEETMDKLLALFHRLDKNKNGSLSVDRADTF